MNVANKCLIVEFFCARRIVWTCPSGCHWKQLSGGFKSRSPHALITRHIRAAVTKQTSLVLRQQHVCRP